MSRTSNLPKKIKKDAFIGSETNNVTDRYCHKRWQEGGQWAFISMSSLSNDKNCVKMVCVVWKIWVVGTDSDGWKQEKCATATNGQRRTETDKDGQRRTEIRRKTTRGRSRKWAKRLRWQTRAMMRWRGKDDDGNKRLRLCCVLLWWVSSTKISGV